MRHQKTFRKFGRSPSHRRAMFRNLTTSLFRHERLETTVSKAKDLRRVAETLITLAGDDTLHARRQAYSYLLDKKVVHKLFAEIGPRYKSRPGGYTRVIRSRTRSGDAAEMAFIELVQEEASTKKKKAKKSSSAGKRTKKAAPSSKQADPTIDDAEKGGAEKEAKKPAAKKKASAKKPSDKKAATKKKSAAKKSDKAKSEKSE